MKNTTIEQLTVRNLTNSLEEDLAVFIQHHRSSLHSEATIDCYLYHIESFQKYTVSLGIESNTELETCHLRDHLIELRERGLSPATVHGRYRHIKAYTKFLAGQGMIQACPFRDVKAPKKPKVIQPALSNDDVTKMLRAINQSTIYGVRDTAIVYTLLDSAMRASELLSLTCGQVDPVSGVVKITGKGSKDRYVKLGTKALRSLSKWLRLRQGDPGEPVWIGKKGELSEWGLRMMFHRLGKRADIHVHPHKLRRTSALMMLRSGMDLVTLSKIMGHASIETTRLYLDLDLSDIVRAHIQHSPVDSLKAG